MYIWTIYFLNINISKIHTYIHIYLYIHTRCTRGDGLNVGVMQQSFTSTSQLLAFRTTLTLHQGLFPFPDALGSPLFFLGVEFFGQGQTSRAQIWPRVICCWSKRMQSCTAEKVGPSDCAGCRHSVTLQSIGWPTIFFQQGEKNSSGNTPCFCWGVMCVPLRKMAVFGFFSDFRFANERWGKVTELLSIQSPQVLAGMRWNNRYTINLFFFLLLLLWFLWGKQKTATIHRRLVTRKILSFSQGIWILPRMTKQDPQVLGIIFLKNVPQDSPRS